MFPSGPSAPSSDPPAPASAGRGGDPPVPVSAPLPQPGELLNGRYRVGDIHRAGGMGVVFRGVDERTGGEIAIKTVRQGCGKAVLARFVLEAELPVPQHPCLAQTLDRFIAGGRPYQVQEFVPGRSLQEILQSREDGMTPESAAEEPWFDPARQTETAVRALAQVARGLEALHQAGVLHRDLKPANLVWHEAGRAVVVDFGLAVHEAHSHLLTTTGQAVGTVGFMAPEQRRGKELDQRADVYALGATLWFLLPGSPPLAANRPPARPDLPPSLSEALLTALEQNPARRFPSLAAFADALDGWLEDPASTAVRTSRSTVCRRWLARNRLGLAVGSSMVFLLLTVLLARALWLESGASAAAVWHVQVGHAREAAQRITGLLERREEQEEVAFERDLQELLAMVAADPTMRGDETRSSRRAAIEFLLLTGRAEEARRRVAEWPALEPGWAEFEDYRLQASVLAAASDLEGAIRFLKEGAAHWPEKADLAAAASRALERLRQAVVLPWSYCGIFREKLGDTAALVVEKGGAVVLRFDDNGEIQRLPIGPPGSFSGGWIAGGCRIRRDGLVLGSLLYFQSIIPREEGASRGGIYWQPVDSALAPSLVLARPSIPGLWMGGMIAADLLGDGQDEVILPLANTDGGAAILRLEEAGWRSYWLPIQGNDVQAVQVIPARAGTPASFWLGTSIWNVANQGYRLHRFSVEPEEGGLLLRRHSRLPVGAVSSFGPLRGWGAAASAFASFAFLDDAVLFGGEYRSARAAEVWLMKEHEGHGLCPENKLWGMPRVSRFAKEDLTAAAADLDADERDEIYSCWKWREYRGGCFSVSDGRGGSLRVDLPWAAVSAQVLHDTAAGGDALLFGYETRQFLIIPGMPGVVSPTMTSSPTPGLRRVVLARHGGSDLEGSFRVPESWQPGDGGEWLAAGFRISHADFHSGASLLIERRDGEGERETPVGLELTTQGGGGVYNHVLEASAEGKGGKFRQAASGLELLPGGWVEILLRPDAEGTGMVIDVRQERGTPGGGSSRTFPVPIRPVAGAGYRWSWLPHSQESGVEARDRFAVLALEWNGPGTRPPGGIDRAGAVAELAEVERLYQELVEAAERGDFSVFESARAALEVLAPHPREGTRSKWPRNGLAAYRLESAPVWLMRGAGR